MSFSRKNLQQKSGRKLTIFKYLTIFFLGASCVLLMAQAQVFNIDTSIDNAIQYIQQIFLTEDGSNTSPTTIILDGTTGGGITITNLPNEVVLGTDSSGKIIGSDASSVYDYISGFDNYLTGMSFNSGNNLLTLYVSGYGPVTGYINLSGANNWNSVYNRMLTSGNTLRNWYITTGNYATNRVINNITGALANYYTTGLSFDSGNNLLTLYVSGYGPVTGYITLSGANNWNSFYNRYISSGFSLLNCAPGEVIKYNGSTWECSGDLVGGTSFWTTGINVNDIYNLNSRNVGIGIDDPTDNKLQIAGNITSSGLIARGDSVHAGGLFSTAIGHGTYASGQDSIAMGSDTHAEGNYSTAMGHSTTADSWYSTVMGYANTTWGEASFVGGEGNHGTGANSFIGGGQYNNLYGINSFIGGGINNTITGGSWGFIIGRLGYNSIVGGYQNVIQWGDNNFIGGGKENNIIGNYGVTYADYNFIGGGYRNTITGDSQYSTIPGGESNNIEDVKRSLVGGGKYNGIGSDNNYSVIVGGYTNNIVGSTSHIYNFIGGGNNNTITNGGSYSTPGCFIGGGTQNIISNGSDDAGGFNSVIVGGISNKIFAGESSIVGGLNNTVGTGSGISFIGGGTTNTIEGASSASFIGGGYDNSISGYSQYSTIPGGKSNSIVDANYSFVGGYNAHALNNNSFVRNSDGATDFSSTKTGTFIINAPYEEGVKGGVGINTNNPLRDLHIGGSGTVVFEPQPTRDPSCSVTGAVYFADRVDWSGGTAGMLCYCNGTYWLKVFDNNRCISAS